MFSVLLSLRFSQMKSLYLIFPCFILYGRPDQLKLAYTEAHVMSHCHEIWQSHAEYRRR